MKKQLVLIALLLAVLVAGFASMGMAAAPTGGAANDFEGNARFRNLTWVSVYGDIWLQDDLTVADDAAVGGDLSYAGVLYSTNIDTVHAGETSILTIGLTNCVVWSDSAEIDSFDTASTLPNWARVLIYFQRADTGSVGFTDGKNLKLTANLDYTADDVLEVVRIGDNLVEVGRNVN